METKIYSQVPAYLRAPPLYSPQPQIAAAYGALNTTSMARVEYISPFAANNQHLLQQQLIQQQLLQIQQAPDEYNDNREKRARVETPKREEGIVNDCKAVELCSAEHGYHHTQCRKSPDEHNPQFLKVKTEEENDDGISEEFLSGSRNKRQ